MPRASNYYKLYCFGYCAGHTQTVRPSTVLSAPDITPPSLPTPHPSRFSHLPSVKTNCNTLNMEKYSNVILFHMKIHLHLTNGFVRVCIASGVGGSACSDILLSLFFVNAWLQFTKASFTLSLHL